MMRRIATATDHVLMSAVAGVFVRSTGANSSRCPSVDPRLEVAFAVIRLQGRTLPPIADELIEDFFAADL